MPTKARRRDPLRGQTKWGKTMMKVMKIDGYRAVIKYDPEIERFRGGLVGLNGGVDYFSGRTLHGAHGLRLSCLLFMPLAHCVACSPSMRFTRRPAHVFQYFVLEVMFIFLFCTSFVWTLVNLS